MTSAAMQRETPHSVDREAAELRRRWWDDRETSEELVLDIARFESRTQRVIIAPGEATRPGLLEVAAPLLERHPEEPTLHRVVREAAQAMPVGDRTACWRDTEGQWHVDWPGQGLRFVVEGDAAPWSAGIRRWKIADQAFYQRERVWRVIRRLLRGVPKAYPERDDDAVQTLRWDEEQGVWRGGLSYIEDVIMADHLYSLSISFRPEDGVVEIFESVDTE